LGGTAHKRVLGFTPSSFGGAPPIKKSGVGDSFFGYNPRGFSLTTKVFFLGASKPPYFGVIMYFHRGEFSPPKERVTSGGVIILYI